MFQMAKVWVDPNDRVDSVEIRYTWSAVGTPPDFTNGKDEAEVMQVVIMALALSLLATLYPSWRAARTDPVEALRHE